MANSYEGFEAIFASVVLGYCEWKNNGPLDSIAEVWEKKFIKKSRLTAMDQSYSDVYKDAINDYTELVIWYSNLSELEKNKIYSEWSKRTLLTKIKYSEE
jgi:hypothetical protein